VAYQVAHSRAVEGIATLVRDPRSSMQVWSRFQGYPGDPSYLEFHKMRWPGGLKLWRVTGGEVDLGGKEPYDPEAALQRARVHADHFVGLLGGIAAGEGQRRDGVIVAPFDTELFGHWWFEGPAWLGAVYRALARDGRGIRPVTASRHLADHPAKQPIRLPSGSWGAKGDFSMWLGDDTVWTWERLWPLEETFWDAAPAADYAERRFTEHCDDAQVLLAALAPGAEEWLPQAQARAEELARRDDLFPDVLSAVAAALGGSRSLVFS
jgi:predicted glycosyl hydrolase (DUF1957 family)